MKEKSFKRPINKVIIFLFIIYFFQGITTNMHHPLIPYYIKYLKLDSYMVGLHFSFMNLGIFLGGPFWGNLGDKGRRKEVIIIGYFIYAIGQVFYGLGEIYFNGWQLIIFRLLSGFGITAATTGIMSEIIKRSSKDRKTKNISYAVAILALGASCGYLLGGLLHTRDFFINTLKIDEFYKKFLLQGILVGILLLFFLIFYKKTKGIGKPFAEVKEKNNKISILKNLKEIKNVKKSLIFFLIAITIVTISQTNMDKYLEIYFSDLGYNADTIGKFNLIVGLITISLTFTIVPLLLKTDKNFIISIILQILSATIAFIVFRVSSKIFMRVIYSVYMIYISSKAVFAPLEQNQVSKYANESNIGKIMGIRQSFFALGTIIGPLFGGILYGINKILVFDVSAGLFLFSVIFIIWSYYFYRKENSISEKNKFSNN